MKKIILGTFWTIRLFAILWLYCRYHRGQVSWEINRDILSNSTKANESKRSIHFVKRCNHKDVITVLLRYTICKMKPEKNRHISPYGITTDIGQKTTSNHLLLLGYNQEFAISKSGPNRQSQIVAEIELPLMWLIMDNESEFLVQDKLSWRNCDKARFAAKRTSDELGEQWVIYDENHLKKWYSEMVKDEKTTWRHGK